MSHPLPNRSLHIVLCPAEVPSLSNAGPCTGRSRDVTASSEHNACREQRIAGRRQKYAEKLSSQAVAASQGLQESIFTITVHGF